MKASSAKNLSRRKTSRGENSAAAFLIVHSAVCHTARVAGKERRDGKKKKKTVRGGERGTTSTSCPELWQHRNAKGDSSRKKKKRVPVTTQQCQCRRLTTLDTRGVPFIATCGAPAVALRRARPTPAAAAAATVSCSASSPGQRRCRLRCGGRRRR